MMAIDTENEVMIQIRIQAENFFFIRILGWHESTSPEFTIIH